MEIIKKYHFYYLKTTTFCEPIKNVLPYLNNVLRNYDKLLKERNLLEVQLIQANANTEALLRELRKNNPTSYPQPEPKETLEMV